MTIVQLGLLALGSILLGVWVGICLWRRDALRYREVRSWRGGGLSGWNVVCRGLPDSGAVSGEGLDATVDACMEYRRSTAWEA